MRIALEGERDTRVDAREHEVATDMAAPARQCPAEMTAVTAWRQSAHS
jgi:hypothetical protein